MREAKEMRAITDKVIEERIAKRKTQAEEFLETRIMPQIERAAGCGRYEESYMIDAGIDKLHMVDVLRSSGYEVTHQGNTLKISWE